MTQSKSTETQNQQSDHKSEADIAKEKAGQSTDKSSHEHMSRQKAGKHEGAGGGAKQKQNHR
jgi:hypothetical protein